MKYTQLKNSQQGFEMVGLLFVVVILAVIGFTSFKVWNNSQNKTVANNASTAAAKTSVVPATINSKGDLTQVSNALDTSSAQVNSQVNGDSLNGDINNLL
jgi:Tfp pilus assembly protein PilE